MNPSSATPIDVDTLMSSIRAEVARRRRAAASSEIDAGGHEANATIAQIILSPLPSPKLPKQQFAPAERYHLNDFLALHDEDFIDAAYRGVVKRGADAQGRQHFLVSLRSGALSKIEILGRLRYSPEGRRQRVPVRGLLPAFAAQHTYRLPLIGGAVAFVIALFRLPRIARNLQGLEGYQHQRNTELESAIRNLAQAADLNERQLGAGIDRGASGLNELMQHFDEASAELSRRAEIVSAEARAKLAEHSQTNEAALRRVSSLEKALDTENARTHAQITAVEQRIATSESRSDALDNRIAHSELRSDALDNRIAHSESSNDALERRVAASESHKQDIDRQLVDVIAQSQQTSAQLASTLHETLGALEKRIDGLNRALESEQGDARSSRLRLLERMARVEGRVHEHGLRLAEPLPNTGRKTVKDPVQVHSPSRFEQIYFAFEQRFRGSREDIRQRLSYYLPMLQDSVVGTDGATVLDVGCGRGEWLQLLRDEKISARGIDINETMAQECIKRGLDVDVGDAIAKLRQLPDNALGALTGFHIIEHVSLDTLIELIEQAHRVVRPGGLVIFETPNPENLAVGACSFYIDPTHQRPLPPVLTQFLVEAGGFADVVIHRVNANLLPQVFEEPGENDPPALRTALNYLRSTFLCAPDYSVVGHVA